MRERNLAQLLKKGARTGVERHTIAKHRGAQAPFFRRRGMLSTDDLVARWIVDIDWKT